MSTRLLNLQCNGPQLRNVMIWGTYALDEWCSMYIHFLKDMKHTINAQWLANPKRDGSHMPHHFWHSYEYPIQYQSEDYCAH